MTRPLDLLIVGGGVLGTFHAYHALARGFDVMLVERTARPEGATVRNFGQVVPSGMDERWQRFGRESLQIYKDIQRRTDITVRELGTIYIASDEEEQMLIEELHAINKSNDYPSELWDAAKCRERYPQLKAEYCRAGLFFPEEVSVNPRKMILQLQDFLSRDSGFQSRFNTCVVNLNVINEQGQQLVEARTNDGSRLLARKAVVCSGSEFRTLYPEHFAKSELVAVKLQMLRLCPQRQIDIPGNVLTGLSIRRYESFSECASWEAVKSREDSESFEKQWGIHILFKQESDGSIILGDSHEYAKAKDVDQLGFELRDDISRFFVDEGRKIFDLPEWDIESAWAGIYCQTDAEEGIHTETIDDHIHIVTGIGGKGMTSSAGYAKHHLGEIYND